MRYLILVLVVLAQNADKPKLVTSVFPPIQIYRQDSCKNATRSNVILTAEIKGIEDEDWYCPKVEWEGLGSVESDCVPFEERYECYPKQSNECALDWHIDPATGGKIIDSNPCGCEIPGYPRVWRRRLCAPTHPEGQAWSVVVRLTKNGKAIAREEIRFFVK
jgi:hypothetical protein